MPNSLLVIGLWLTVLAACVFALVKGGPAERFGGALTLAISLSFLTVNALLPEQARPIPHLVLDGVLAVGFLFLAVRYASLWIGAVMLLQGIQFSLHAYFFVTKLTPGVTYAVVNNAVTIGTIVGLLCGTVVASRRERLSKSVGVARLPQGS
ncbi:hypothetical protein [Phenylobacterium sp.]|uniref:hypothetical protein n=1 Tax=Phenylobacterium sp. TaxID=1871053 RepID=UPI002717EEA2|nr:hypothetical protein [Phenylobacterium sp.]MDO8798949.1 hypothetical protein [Phenylobacterium sp.]